MSDEKPSAERGPSCAVFHEGDNYLESFDLPREVDAANQALAQLAGFLSDHLQTGKDFVVWRDGRVAAVLAATGQNAHVTIFENGTNERTIVVNLAGSPQSSGVGTASANEIRFRPVCILFETNADETDSARNDRLFAASKDAINQVCRTASTAGVSDVVVTVTGFGPDGPSIPDSVSVDKEPHWDELMAKAQEEGKLFVVVQAVHRAEKYRYFKEELPYPPVAKLLQSPTSVRQHLGPGCFPVIVNVGGGFALFPCPIPE